MTSIMNLPRGEKFHADNAAYKLTRTPLVECTQKRMAQAMYHATFELYRVRRINRAKWHGVAKVWGAGILRFMSVELWTEDITAIEERLERKLADCEDFRANPLTFTPRRFINRLWKGAVHVSDGRTQYSVAETPKPSPVSIILYGSLYTPVTLKVQNTPVTVDELPVTKAITPDENIRKELDGELVTLQRIEYAPMGNKVAWWGYADSYGVTVRFRIYPEHAALFPEAGQARLPHADKDMPDISVVLAWNKHHNDLRIDSVYGSDGKHFTSLSKPKPLAVAAPVEDRRTEFQKKLGMNSPYIKRMDFRLNKPKAS